MKANYFSRQGRPPGIRLTKMRAAVWLLLAAAQPAGLRAAAQAGATEAVKAAAATPQKLREPSAATPTPLAALVEEARQKDPKILAAEEAARAAGYVAPRVSALPDPTFTIQHFSVGSPRPFAGYSNSDFAYLGFGASQEFPFPGKRKLRGEVANRETGVREERAETVRREETEKLKAAYYRLAYLQRALGILDRNDTLVGQAAEVAEARYRSGGGNQQDVLKAQLQHTKILYEISMNRQAAGEAQAELKRILRRPQDAPDIVAEPLTLTPLGYSAADLLARVNERNSEVRERTAMIHKSQAEIEMAKKEFRPDFGLSYMYQHTSDKFRDYYMATFDVKFARRKPREAALAEANVNLERAKQEKDAQMQEAAADLQKALLEAQTAEDQARLYREGLIPQARATYEAGLAAYQANREDFETLLSSLLDNLSLDLQYEQTLLGHETAMARIERLAGVTLP